jgi:hypothetical protein
MFDFNTTSIYDFLDLHYKKLISQMNLKLGLHLVAFAVHPFQSNMTQERQIHSITVYT